MSKEKRLSFKNMGNDKYIFVNREDNYKEIRVYYKNHVYNVSFPINLAAIQHISLLTASSFPP